MEENKKTVELNPERKEEKKRWSYEELNNIAVQLSEQNRQLHIQLQQANMTNAFKRLDYLFKIVENSAIFNTEFVDSCISEIE